MISCLAAEIHAFEVYRPPSWIFPLAVRSHSLLISSSELLDTQYISLVAVAVGFSFLSSLGAELFAFEVLLAATLDYPLPVSLYSNRTNGGCKRKLRLIFVIFV